MSRWSRVTRNGLAVSAALVLAGCSAFGSCGGGSGSDGKKAVSTEAAGELASYMPAEAKGAMVVQNPKSIIDSYTGWLAEKRKEIEEEGIDEEAGLDLEKYEKEYTEKLGFNPYKAEEWKKTGIDLKTPFVGGIFGEQDLVLLAKVADKKKFETFVKNAGEEKKLEDKKVDGQSLKVSKGDASWCYNGDIVVFGDKNNQKRLASICKAKPEKGLSDDKGFKTFRDSLLAYHPVGIYVEPGQVIDEGDFTEGTKKWLKSNVVSSGAAFDYSDGKFAARGWAGLTDSAASQAKALMTANKEVDWKKFGVADTMAAMRLSMNPEKFLEFMRSTMDERDLEEFNQSLKMMSQATGGELDAEKDVIQKLSGQIGLFLYDVNVPSNMGAMGMMQAAQSLRYIGVIQFADAKSRDKIIDQVEKTLKAQGMGGKMTRGPLTTADGTKDESIEVMQLPVPMVPKMYLYNDLLAMAPNSIGSGEMQAFLKGERKEKKLGSAEGQKLGAKVIEQANMNGLYINHARIAEKLKGSESFKSAAKFFEQFHGQIIQGRVDGTDFYYETVMTTNPKAPSYGELLKTATEAFGSYIEKSQNAGTGQDLKLKGGDTLDMPSNGDSPKLKLKMDDTKK